MAEARTCNTGEILVSLKFLDPDIMYGNITYSM